MRKRELKSERYAVTSVSAVTDLVFLSIRNEGDVQRPPVDKRATLFRGMAWVSSIRSAIAGEGSTHQL